MHLKIIYLLLIMELLVINHLYISHLHLIMDNQIIIKIYINPLHLKTIVPMQHIIILHLLHRQVTDNNQMFFHLKMTRVMQNQEERNKRKKLEEPNKVVLHHLATHFNIQTIIIIIVISKQDLVREHLKYNYHKKCVSVLCCSCAYLLFYL